MHEIIELPFLCLGKGGGRDKGRTKAENHRTTHLVWPGVDAVGRTKRVATQDGKVIRERLVRRESECGRETITRVAMGTQKQHMAKLPLAPPRVRAMRGKRGDRKVTNARPLTLRQVVQTKQSACQGLPRAVT